MKSIEKADLEAVDCNCPHILAEFGGLGCKHLAVEISK